MRAPQALTPATPARSRQIDGILGLLGCVLCWGAVPVLLRQLTGVIDAWTANGVRYPMSAVLYWPVLYATWRRGNLNGPLVRRALVPALFALLGQIFWGLAPYYLPASAIGFYVRFSMVAALVASMLLFPDERKLLARPWFYLGMGLVIGGFIWFSRSQGATQDARTWIGVLMMLACALFFGLYGVSVRYYLQDVNPILGFALVSQFVSIGTLAGMAAEGDPGSLLRLQGGDWMRLFASTILGIALGHIFMYRAVQNLGATITSAVQTLTPFVTVLLAWMLLGESLSAGQWLAGGMMVAGALVLVRL